MGGFAWVTLATNDSYSLGALVLAHSLRRVNTAHQLVVLITPGVTEAMKTQLSAVFNIVKLVDVLDSKDADNLALLARPELGVTFTKLHCWKLTEFDKCVFLDADTLVLQNSDELFEREELSAAPDAGWPDCFNSGVFVYKPSNDTFNAIIEFALIHGSFDGGDQGLLNLFFSDWPTKDIRKHLPFVYNMCSTATYSYLPAFKQFGKGLKIIHFIGAAKPWLQPFNTETGLASISGDSQHIVQFVQLWWDIFCTHVHPSLSTEMAGLAGALASVTLGAPLSAEQMALEEHLRRQGWEQGNIDYMGKDSFSNIWKKICDTLASGPPPRMAPPEEVPAPVAPVAAPVYVSSVEISPTGPIDTSPPASYAPVSAPKPTVVDSDSEAATKAAPAETATIIPEPLSPSVTEVVSTQAITSPAAVEPAKQPSTPVAVVSSETAAAVAPLLESTPSPATVESAISTPTSVQTVTAGAQPVSSSSSTPAVQSPVILSQAVVPVPDAPVLANISASITPVPVPTETPIILPLQTPTPVQTPAPVPQTLTSTTVSTTPLVSSAAIVKDVPVPDATSKKDPISPPPTGIVSSTETQITGTAVPLVSALREAAVPTQSPPLETQTSTTPVINPPSGIEITDSFKPVLAEAPTPTAPLPGEILQIPAIAPTFDLAPVALIVAEPTPSITTGPTETPVPIAQGTVSSPLSTQVPLETSASINTVSTAPITPVPAEVPSNVSGSIPAVPVEPALPLSPPLSPQPAPSPSKSIIPVTTPAPSQKTTSTPSSPVTTADVPSLPVSVQPGTPTVTGPTPPTSPPASTLESPLTAKLKVDTEVPATPPVGTSTSQPSLAAAQPEEPPVPPKRKGGAKAHEAKNQKGGKSSKGKK